VRAAGAVVAPVAPTEGPYAQVAHARSATDSRAAELARSGWALADYWAGLLAHDWAGLRADDSAGAVVPAARWAVGTVPAYWALVGWAVLTAHGSTPVDDSQQAGPSEQHSRDA